MKKIFSLVNQKGGVGKTSSAVNLACALSEIFKKKVLLLDIDPQGNVSTTLGLDKSLYANKNIYQAISGQMSIKETIYKHSEHLDICPSDNDLVAAEIELASQFSREKKLSSLLSEVKELYDYIIIDCPPSFNLLTINALSATEEVLIPLQTELLALEGLTQIVKNIPLIKNALNPELNIKGIFFTMFDKRNNFHKTIKEAVESNFDNRIFKNHIPRTIKVSEAQNHQKSLFSYDLKNPASLAYLALCHEVFIIEPVEFNQKIENYLQEKNVKNFPWERLKEDL